MPDRRDALAAAAAHARACWPHEACGVVVRNPTGRHRFLAVPNVAATPRSSFELDPVEQLAIWKAAAGGAFALVALVHSHPDGDTAFSPADRVAATAPDGRPLHPGLEHWVLGVRGPAPLLTSASAWTWRAGSWDEQALDLPQAGCGEFVT